MSARAYDVVLASKVIDTVFADYADADEMRRSLIDHDGYDPRIKVYLRSKNGRGFEQYAGPNGD